MRRKLNPITPKPAKHKRKKSVSIEIVLSPKERLEYYRQTVREKKFDETDFCRDQEHEDLDFFGDGKK